MAEYMQYWRFGMKINILFRPKGSIQVYWLLFTRLMIVFFNTNLVIESKSYMILIAFTPVAEFTPVPVKTIKIVTNWTRQDKDKVQIFHKI